MTDGRAANSLGARKTNSSMSSKKHEPNRADAQALDIRDPKFWNRPEGAEAILQVRAALLSEDGRLQRYFADRPGNPYRRRAA